MLSNLESPPLPRPKSLLVQYESPLRKETGSFNLMSYIKNPLKHNREKMAKKVVTTIRVRRLLTDELFPYDAQMFATWFYNDGQKTDPVTKENLDYIEKRVSFKMECLMFPDQEYLVDACSDAELQATMARSFFQNCESLAEYPKDFVVPLKLTTSMFVLDKIGLLHYGVDPKFNSMAKVCYGLSHDLTARRLLAAKYQRCGCFSLYPDLKHKCLQRHRLWFMRVSTQPFNKLMPHASMLTFTRMDGPDQGTGAAIKHARYICIDGIGWYIVPDSYLDHSISSSFMFFSQLTIDRKPQTPVAVTLIDLIEHFRKQHKLRYQDLLDRGDLKQNFISPNKQ